MGEYYYDQYGRDSDRQSFAMTVVDTLFTVVSIVALVAMILTIATSYINPSVSIIFSLLTLISPAVYIVNVLLALYWVIRWKWIRASAMLLPLLIAMPAISRYYNIETSKSYGDLPRRGVVKIMSYNIKGFVDLDGKVVNDKLYTYIDEQRPDIICFQEYSKYLEPDVLPKFLDKYYTSQARGLKIFSRFKIKESSKNIIDSLTFKTGSAFWSDILIGEDTLRLYNLHLHSTTINHKDDEYIRNMEFMNDSISDNSIKGMLGRFQETSVARAMQADTIANSIAQTANRVVVCGDFNDTPNSYAYRKISDGLQDAFQEKGIGYSHTYREFMNLLRIDYILVEEPIEILSYEVDESAPFSDHLPVTAILKI